MVEEWLFTLRLNINKDVYNIEGKLHWLTNVLKRNLNYIVRQYIGLIESILLLLGCVKTKEIKLNFLAL